MPMNAFRVALPMRSASAGSRNARERSGESRWMSAAWTERKGGLRRYELQNASRVRACRHGSRRIDSVSMRMNLDNAERYLS
jgi:hypothetical protein